MRERFLALDGLRGLAALMVAARADASPRASDHPLARRRSGEPMKNRELVMIALLVVIVGALLYALPILQKLWSDGANEIEAAQIAGVAIAALALPMLHFYDPHGGNDRVFALIAFAAALAPAGAAAFGWRCETRKHDARFVLLITTCATLMAAVFMLALEPWAWAPAVGGVALATLLLGHKADDPMVEYAAWGFAGLGLLLMTANTDLLDEIAGPA